MQGKEMSRRACVLFAVIFCASGLARAGSVADAWKLLKEGQADKVDQVLAEELAKEHPAKEALQVSLEAALELGRFVTAQQRAARLLDNGGTVTPDMLYQAAEIADLAGSGRLAVTRYRTYVEQAPKGDPKLKSALEYLLRHRIYPDEYKRYVSLYGTSRKSWWLGRIQLSRLLNEFETDAALDLADFLLSHFKKPGDYDYVFQQLTQAAQNQSLGKDVESQYRRPLEIVLKQKDPPQASYEYFFETCLNYLYGKWGNEERVEKLFMMQDRIRGPLRPNFVRRFEWMRSLGKPEERIAAGRRYLALEPRYKGATRDHYEYYLRNIIDSPQVFNVGSNALVSAEGMKERFEDLLSRYGDARSNSELARMLWQIQAQYLPTNINVRLDYMKQHLAWLPSDYVDDVVALSGGKNIDAIVKEYGTSKSFSAVLDAKVRLLSWYNKLGRTNDVKSIVRSYMFSRPATFEHDQLVPQCFNNDAFSADERLGVISELVQKAGGGAAVQGLIAEMKKQKSWAENKTFLELEKQAASSEKGSDPALHALMTLHRIPENRGNPDAAVYNTAKQFLDTFNGRIPGKQDSPEKVVLYHIFQKHGYHVWENREGLIAWAELWAPYLDMGGSWSWMVNRLAQQDAHQTLREILFPVFVKLVNGGAEVPSYVWRAWANMHMTPGNTETPLAAFYDKMGPVNAVAHLYEQRDVWSSNQKVMMEGIAKFASDPAFPFSDWYWREFVGRFYYWSSTSIPAPMIVTQKLWDYLEAHRDSLGYDPQYETMIYGQYWRSGHYKEAQEFLLKYLPMSKERGTWAHISMINYLFGIGVPADSHDALTPGRRYHIILKELKPLLLGLPEDERVDLTVRTEVFNAVYDALRSWPDGPQKKEAAEFAEELVDMAMNDGVSLYGHLPYVFPVIEYSIRESLTAGKGKEALRRLSFLAGQLNRYGYWDRTYDDTIQPMIDWLGKQNAYEMQYAFIGALLRSGNMPDEFSQKLTVLRSKAGQEIPGLIPVDEKDPMYPLYQAANAYDVGNEARAWKLTAPRLQLLPKVWAKLDPAYVAWSLEQMRKQKMLNDALNFAFTILLREKELDPEVAARVSLIKGDIQRDTQNYQAARIEYQSLQSNRRYRDTDAGRAARFHLIELLILTRDYSSAEQQLERLVESSNMDFRAEANYLLARIAFDRKDYEQSRDYLNEVFKLQHDHVKARLLEGELKLKLPGGLIDTEVAVGNPELKTIAIPGRELTLKLQDSNLSVARGGAAIPVLVRTSAGGDVEKVDLLPNPNDKTMFIGKIQTELGEAQHNNLMLELNGRDDVSYEIDPEFQKANDLKYPPKVLKVRYDAELAASSGQILSREEAEKMELQERLQNTMEESARFRGRTGRTVRPGSPVYVQVIDLDEDMTNGIDTVTVNLRTSSGDILEGFVLKETGPHTGIFRAEVPTSVPAPRASASDTEEGKDPSVVINSTKTGEWNSLADGKAPKWFEVDTMGSHEIGGGSIVVPNHEEVKAVTLLGLLDEDYKAIAYFPARKSRGEGGMQITLAPNQRGASAASIHRYLQGASETEYRQDKTEFDRDDTPYKGRNGYISGQIKGAFYLGENTVLELKFLQEMSPHGWQYAYLLMDGDVVLGGRMYPESSMNQTRRVALTKGIHKFEVLFRDHWSGCKIVVGYRKDDGSFEPLPQEWFSVEKNPALAEYLDTRGIIEKTEDGFVAKLDRPARLRKVRWVFDEFTGNAISLREMHLTDAEGKPLIPVKQDFTMGTQNRQLEVSPGDHITVTYTDDRRASSDEPELLAELSSSFYNGSVMFGHEEIRVVNGAKITSYAPAKRCRIGDQLMIVVNEYDEDLSEERDTLDVKVETSGGETLTVKALETAASPFERYSPHAGVFMATLQFGTETAGNTIKVQPGDSVKVTYLDRENNRPGVPIERSYSLQEASLGEPDILVYRTRVKLVQDTSREARMKIERMRRQGLRDEDIVLYREQILAADPEYLANQNKNEDAKQEAPEETGDESVITASVNAPLLFEVYYPKMALHAGSVFNVEAVSEAELKAAKAENREPDVLKVPVYVKSIIGLAADKGYPVQLQSFQRKDNSTMLASGTFAGVIRLQVGSHGDPVDDLVVAGHKEFVSRYRSEDAENFSDYAYRVPTLLVAGSDVVHVRVRDMDGKVAATQNIRLLSDGQLELLDGSLTYRKPAIHLGESFYIRVTDPDCDASDEQESVKVRVTSDSGDAVTLALKETVAHSGVFTGSLQPRFSESRDKTNGAPENVTAAAEGAATAANTNESAAVAPVSAAEDEFLEVNFGDQVTFEYIDDRSVGSNEPHAVTATGRIRLGADADLAGFTKRFKDPEMAVKTRFLLAEALFEMAKDHRKLKQEDLAEERIARGKRILEEAMRDYPNTSLASQGEFLLGNLAQELGKYEEAVGRYANVISHWPDSEYAARSQFKKAICLEKMEHYKQACEEYVKLTYLYPDSGLVAEATARLGNYFYKNEKFDTAARIFYRFQQNNPDHSLAPKALFLAAQCHLRRKDYGAAIPSLKLLLDTYGEAHDLRPEVMYWLGDSYTQVRNYVSAYRTFKQLTWDYPTTKWAKIARGRLTKSVYRGMETGG